MNTLLTFATRVLLTHLQRSTMDLPIELVRWWVDYGIWSPDAFSLGSDPRVPADLLDNYIRDLEWSPSDPDTQWKAYCVTTLVAGLLTRSTADVPYLVGTLERTAIAGRGRNPGTPHSSTSFGLQALAEDELAVRRLNRVLGKSTFSAEWRLARRAAANVPHQPALSLRPGPYRPARAKIWLKNPPSAYADYLISGLLKVMATTDADPTTVFGLAATILSPDCADHSLGARSRLTAHQLCETIAAVLSPTAG